MTDNLGSDYGMAGPSSTMGVAKRSPEEIRAAQVVVASYCVDLGLSDQEALDAARDIMFMLGLL